MAKTLLFLCLLCTNAVSFSAAASKHHETISGRVVAYSSLPLCFNGHADWEMMIHTQDPKHGRAEFIRVAFSYPLCGEDPKWFSANPALQKFRLARDKDNDRLLDKFMGLVFYDLATGEARQEARQDDIPMWHYLPGAEQEKLPFGQIVPGYTSVDFPRLPVF